MKLGSSRRTLWRVMSMVTGTLALLGGLVVAAPSASASPTCSGYSCHGRDPYIYNCGKWTVTSAAAYSGSTKLAVVNNWYGHCNANWSEGYLTSAGLNAHDSIVIDVATSDSQNHGEFMCEPNIYGSGNTGYLNEPCVGTPYTYCGHATSAYGGSGTAWTDMVDGTNLTGSEVCVFHGSTLVAYAATTQ